MSESEKVSFYYEDTCPHLNQIHGIEIEYIKLHLSGKLTSGYKKAAAKCDYTSECKFKDEHGRCPVYLAAPQNPYERTR